MRIFDILTPQDLNSIKNGDNPSFFQYISENTDPYHNEIPTVAQLYFMVHSPMKNVSQYYKRVVDITLQGEQTWQEVIGQFIGDRFREKWTKIYNALVTSNYDVLKDNESTIERVIDDTETTEYDSGTIDTINTESKEVVTNTDNDTDGLYAYNSMAPSATNTNISNSEEVRQKDFDKNRSVTDSKKSGTDTKTLDRSETITEGSRKTSGADLIEQEISLRKREEFYLIVCKDIDSIITIPIY